MSLVNGNLTDDGQGCLALFGPDRLSIAERFAAYHHRHPEVYAEIVALARRMRKTGRRRYSIQGCLEVMRWHRNLAADPADEFKINNDYGAFYARLIMADEADLAGFFETRRSVADNE